MKYNYILNIIDYYLISIEYSSSAVLIICGPIIDVLNNVGDATAHSSIMWPHNPATHFPRPTMCIETCYCHEPFEWRS